MTQGAPVLAGMNNTATTQTVINVTGHWYGLGVIAGNFPGATQLAWCAIQAASIDPGSEALYAIGRGRGVYAVGLDGEGVVSYSYNAHGVTGTSQTQNTAGVLGQNAEGGIGVWGKADGSAHADGTPAGAAVLGANAGEGEGVLGTSVRGHGVRGFTSDLNSGGIFGENGSNSYSGAAVVGLGGAGVGPPRVRCSGGHSLGAVSNGRATDERLPLHGRSDGRRQRGPLPLQDKRHTGTVGEGRINTEPRGT